MDSYGKINIDNYNNREDNKDHISISSGASGIESYHFVGEADLNSQDNISFEDKSFSIVKDYEKEKWNECTSRNSKDMIDWPNKFCYLQEQVKLSTPSHLFDLMFTKELWENMA